MDVDETLVAVHLAALVHPRLQTAEPQDARGDPIPVHPGEVRIGEGPRELAVAQYSQRRNIIPDLLGHAMQPCGGAVAVKLAPQTRTRRGNGICGDQSPPTNVEKRLSLDGDVEQVTAQVLARIAHLQVFHEQVDQPLLGMFHGIGGLRYRAAGDHSTQEHDQQGTHGARSVVIVR